MDGKEAISNAFFGADAGCFNKSHVPDLSLAIVTVSASDLVVSSKLLDILTSSPTIPSSQEGTVEVGEDRVTTRSSTSLCFFRNCLCFLPLAGSFCLVMCWLCRLSISSGAPTSNSTPIYLSYAQFLNVHFVLEKWASHPNCTYNVVHHT